jgi:1-acyl-sn-glycerol-3-phosphate acyltransferase
VDAVRLFRSGELLVIFPEGYPNIDPHPTPKADLDAFLAFRSGFVKMAEQAERDGRTQVAIIPAGLIYTRERGKGWHATVRFGPALFLSDFASAEQLRRAVEARVHALSSALPPPATSSHTPGETLPL